MARSKLSNMTYNLTFEQISILHILEEQEGSNLGLLAEKADRERTTISRMIDGLEKRNLVLRVPDKDDKRQKLLYLTNLGQERLEQMKPIGEEFNKSIYKGIDKEEVEATLATLKKILKNIEEK